MDTIGIANDIMLSLNVINGAALLALQVKAYREHRHKSFLLLALSTITAIFSLALAAAPVFFVGLRPEFAALLMGATVLYALYTFLGIWGVVSLFDSYRDLRKVS